jgi:predicted transcriptional regulator of viral defense system
MVFDELLGLLDKAPVFDTGFLLAGRQNPAYIQRQLAEWVRAGKLWQLRRGLYAPAPPYQKVAPHPFLVANRLVPGSYVSLQSALAYYGLIPEYVPAVTSVNTRRPGRWMTPIAPFIYHRIAPALFFGYERLNVGEDQAAFVASPEKALLDLTYLQPGGDAPVYLSSLRLQNLEQLDLDRLRHLAERAAKPKLRRAAEAIIRLARQEQDMYETL